MKIILKPCPLKIRGAIKYNVMNEGVEKLGSGVWYSDDPYITIIVEKTPLMGHIRLKTISSLLLLQRMSQKNTTATALS